jgi:glutathione S-transferase
LVSDHNANNARHPTKAAPVIQDGKVTLAESGAIVQYILAKYGNGKLQIPVDADNFADYLYYFNFANGYFQPMMTRYSALSRLNLPSGSGDAFTQLAKRNFTQALKIVEDRVGKNTWLAGEEFTAADIMLVVSLTTLRLFFPYGLEEYPATVAYLKRIGERAGYKRAMAKGEAGFTPILGAAAPEPLKPQAADK